MKTSFSAGLLVLSLAMPSISTAGQVFEGFRGRIFNYSNVANDRLTLSLSGSCTRASLRDWNKDIQLCAPVSQKIRIAADGSYTVPTMELALATPAIYPVYSRSLYLQDDSQSGRGIFTAIDDESSNSRIPYTVKPYAFIFKKQKKAVRVIGENGGSLQKLFAQIDAAQKRDEFFCGGGYEGCGLAIQWTASQVLANGELAELSENGPTTDDLKKVAGGKEASGFIVMDYGDSTEKVLLGQSSSTELQIDVEIVYHWKTIKKISKRVDASALMTAFPDVIEIPTNVAIPKDDQ